MSFAKGQVLPIHHVRCRECDTPLQRKSYWRNPSCRACSKRRSRVTALSRELSVREQARRYRILLAVGPYKTYEELLKAIRVRNPHTREHHFDLAIEGRG